MSFQNVKTFCYSVRGESARRPERQGMEVKVPGLEPSPASCYRAGTAAASPCPLPKGKAKSAKQFTASRSSRREGRWKANQNGKS